MTTVDIIILNISIPVVTLLYIYIYIYNPVLYVLYRSLNISAFVEDKYSEALLLGVIHKTTNYIQIGYISIIDI